MAAVYQRGERRWLSDVAVMGDQGQEVRELMLQLQGRAAAASAYFCVGGTAEAHFLPALHLLSCLVPGLVHASAAGTFG